jgi:hypothetical protein
LRARAARDTLDLRRARGPPDSEMDLKMQKIEDTANGAPLAASAEAPETVCRKAWEKPVVAWFDVPTDTQGLGFNPTDGFANLC